MAEACNFTVKKVFTILALYCRNQCDRSTFDFITEAYFNKINKLQHYCAWG